MVGCAEDGFPCRLNSTLSSYVPDCETAGMNLYPEETRIALGGEGGYLVLLFPPVTDGEVYGGQSGNEMIALLTYADGEEEMAKSRRSTIRVGDLDEFSVTMGLWLLFSEGEITGTVSVPVLNDFQSEHN